MTKYFSLLLLVVFSNGVFASEVIPPFYILESILKNNNSPEKIILNFSFEDSELKKSKTKKELIEIVKKLKTINIAEFKKLNTQTDQIVVKTTSNTTLTISFHIIEVDEEVGPGMYYKFKSVSEK
jgi:hypothetical protein